MFTLGQKVRFDIILEREHISEHGRSWIPHPISECEGVIVGLRTKQNGVRDPGCKGGYYGEDSEPPSWDLISTVRVALVATHIRHRHLVVPLENVKPVG